MSNHSWFKIGHTTNLEARSGCTAIVFDHLVPAAVDVRGGAPGTRETTLLQPGSMGLLDAILLSGGSAFGLRAADGVVRYLAEQGRGFQTRAGNVPLVSGAIIFDLGVGQPYYPSAEDGYEAARNADARVLATGQIGAGTGATVAKLGGAPVPGGLGIAVRTAGSVTVAAVIVLNAVGDVRNPSTGEWVAGGSGVERTIAGLAETHEGENTTIGAVMIDAPMDRRALERACISAQAALARCTVPAHTIMDGDTIFAAASSAGAITPLETLAITTLVEQAVEDAILSIFR
jgi:L-aminopeptidase/D-esterase-like protein